MAGSKVLPTPTPRAASGASGDAAAILVTGFSGGANFRTASRNVSSTLFADRTWAATVRANQLRLWFAAMAYVLLCALRRIGLAHTQFAQATCGTIRLKLLKTGALVRVNVRRQEFTLAYAMLGNAAS